MDADRALKAAENGLHWLERILRSKGKHLIYAVVCALPKAQRAAGAAAGLSKRAAGLFGGEGFPMGPYRCAASGYEVLALYLGDVIDELEAELPEDYLEPPPQLDRQGRLTGAMDHWHPNQVQTRRVSLAKLRPRLRTAMEGLDLPALTRRLRSEAGALRRVTTTTETTNTTEVPASPPKAKSAKRPRKPQARLWLLKFLPASDAKPMPRQDVLAAARRRGTDYGNRTVDGYLADLADAGDAVSDGRGWQRTAKGDKLLADRRSAAKA